MDSSENEGLKLCSKRTVLAYKMHIPSYGMSLTYLFGKPMIQYNKE